MMHFFILEEFKTQSTMTSRQFPIQGSHDTYVSSCAIMVFLPQDPPIEPDVPLIPFLALEFRAIFRNTSLAQFLTFAIYFPGAKNEGKFQIGTRMAYRHKANGSHHDQLPPVVVLCSRPLELVAEVDLFDTREVAHQCNDVGPRASLVDVEDWPVIDDDRPDELGAFWQLPYMSSIVIKLESVETPRQLVCFGVNLMACL